MRCISTTPRFRLIPNLGENWFFSQERGAKFLNPKNGNEGADAGGIEAHQPVVERKRHHRYLSGPTQASQRDATQNDDESQICLIQVEGSLGGSCIPPGCSCLRVWSGGVVALLLNHRLVASMPPASDCPLLFLGLIIQKFKRDGLSSLNQRHSCLGYLRCSSCLILG